MFNLIVTLYLLSVMITDQERPEVFFREDFKETPAEVPVTQQHIANPNLILSLYGPGAGVIKKSHHDQPADDPYYIWSGLCEENWAVTLKHKVKNMDLSGNAKVRWRSRQSGFRELHVILKLSDGTWLVSDLKDGASRDWRVNEFNIQDIQWMTLNIDDITEENPVTDPDLTNVEEIGWSDLMRGGGTEASSRIDWIEVEGFAVEK